MRSATSLKNWMRLTGVLLVMGGCTSKPSDNVEAAVSPLEIPVFDCQTKQVSCLSSAKDIQAAGACNDAMGQCLLDSAQKLLDLAKTVLDCQTTARDCVVKGGAQAVASCRQDFMTCVGISTDGDAGIGLPPLGGAGGPFAPPPGGPGFGAAGAGPGRDGHSPQGPNGPSGPGFGGLPVPGAGGNWPNLGDAGLPLPPFAGAPAPQPGMQPPGLPISDPPAFACVMDLRTCVTGGKTAAECASQARECLRTQGGGFPMGH